MNNLKASLKGQVTLSLRVLPPPHFAISLRDCSKGPRRARRVVSRWRLKRFRAELESMDGNDEVEVTGETLCETVMLAMSALGHKATRANY